MHLRRLVPIACVLLTACSVAIRKEEVAAYGTQHYAQPKERVFAASVSALKSMGYAIALEDPKRGLIRTGRLMVGLYASQAPWSGLDPSATLVVSETEFRQYSVEIAPLADGRVEARVTPHKFHGDTEVTDERVWSLSDEKTHWAEFFHALDDAL